MLHSETMDGEGTFKLQLRGWLIRMINSQTIQGLEWFNPTENTYVRIPWSRKGQSEHLGSEYQLYREWAKHRGSLEEEFTKLKSRFRSVLDKSHDFDEIKALHILDNQKGNYKIYRLLTPCEVKAKAEQRKQKGKYEKLEKKSRVTPDSQASSSPNEKFESKSVATNCVEYNQLNQLGADSQDNVTDSSFTQPCLAACIHADNRLLMMETEAPLQHFDAEPSIFPSEQFSPSKAMDAENANIAKGGAVHLRNDQAVALLSPNIVEIPKGSIDNLLNNHVRERPERFHYKFIVRYRGVLQCEFVYDMDHKSSKQHWPPHRQDCNGFRLLYGSDSDQFLRLAMAEKVSDDFNLPSVDLRSYEADDDQVLRILQNMVQGITFTTDNEGNLFVKRLCRSHAFHTDHDNIVRIERKQSYPMFSYRGYVDALLRSKIQNTLPPSPETTVYFGAKPKNSESHGLVTVSITPVAAGPIRSMFYGEEGTSIGVSMSDSIDMLLREMGEVVLAESSSQQ